MSKTVKVFYPAMNHLTNEKQVLISDDGDYIDGKTYHQRIIIHPWDRTSEGWTHSARAVYVSLGELNKKGHQKKMKKGEHEYENVQLAIFDRDDFVEGLIAVFPELTRAK